MKWLWLMLLVIWLTPLWAEEVWISTNPADPENPEYVLAYQQPAAPDRVVVLCAQCHHALYALNVTEVFWDEPIPAGIPLVTTLPAWKEGNEVVCQYCGGLPFWRTHYDQYGQPQGLWFTNKGWMPQRHRHR